MLKTLAFVFGVVLVVIGLLGFVPAASPNGLLLNIFHVNTAHNVVHLVTGLAALLAGWGGISQFTPKLFFQVFGVIYLLVALLGFWYGNAPIFNVLANNLADSFLHLGIAAVSLFLGFGHCCCDGGVCEKK